MDTWGSFWLWFSGPGEYSTVIVHLIKNDVKSKTFTYEHVKSLERTSVQFVAEATCLIAGKWWI